VGYRSQSGAVWQWRTILRLLAAAFFIGAGINHFVNPAFYRRIVPPRFPKPAALVVISGIAEIAGGASLLVRPLRRAAGWGLIALLVAVFPANLYMAMNPDRLPDLPIPRRLQGLRVPLLWLRLPLQAIFIAWVGSVAFDRPGAESKRSE
jgi:uncharacterized membrane protein